LLYSYTLAIKSFIISCCCNINAINNDSSQKKSSLKAASLM
jgi:hypothetical protein